MLTAEAVGELVTASRHEAWQAVMEQLPALVSTVEACLESLGAAPGVQADATCALLLQCLRALRNLCAGGAAAAEAVVVEHGTLSAVARLLELVECAAIQLDWQLPAVTAQLLANAAAAGGDGCAAAVWSAAFPRQLNVLAHVNTGPAQSALALCLLTCCRKVPGAAVELCSPRGVPVMAAMLCGQRRLHQQGHANDNLGLLLSYLCFQQDLLPSLAAALVSPADPDQAPNAQGPAASSGAAGGEDPHVAAAGAAPGAAASVGAAAAAAVAAQPSVALVELLQELSHEVHAEGHLVFGRDGAGERGSEACSAHFMVALVEQLAGAAKAGSLSEGQQQLLQDTLQLMRDIAGVDEGPGSSSLVASLQQAGMLPLLLAMLKALSPIRSPQHPQKSVPGSSGAGASAAGQAVAELAPALAQRAQQLPSQPPYFGYRTDLLSVLSNASYGRPAVKAEIQALGGVELVLSQCQMDPQSPLAREWALWAVRNLCEGNEAAQAAIRELQLCTAVETEEARQLGVKLELDKDTGKLRVTQQQQQQQQQQP